VIRMGRVVALAAAFAIAGPLCALGPAAARAAEVGVPVLRDGVELQARADPGEVPRRHVVAGQIDRLIDRVVALNERYGWSWNATGALIAYLEEAFIDLDDGRPGDAADQLRTFRDRITLGLADGTLASEAGGPLLAATADLLARVEALGGAGPLRDGPPARPAAISK